MVDTSTPARGSRDRVAILGGGNIGGAIARGLVRKGGYDPASVMITRRHRQALESLAVEGFAVLDDNAAAVRGAKTVILAVGPSQLRGLLQEIRDHLDPKGQVLVSVVSGATIDQIRREVGDEVPVVRAMPNTAIAIGESMTCLAATDAAGPFLDSVRAIFDNVGRTLLLDEEQMASATALGACGVAFFLRAIRAASQGGIEVGFHAREAIEIAAQTARGAASLLLADGAHPEREIDNVTTPMGCTISGLNEMEHRGFSSAMIKGIVISAEKAARLYDETI